MTYILFFTKLNVNDFQLVGERWVRGWRQGSHKSSLISMRSSYIPLNPSVEYSLHLTKILILK